MAMTPENPYEFTGFSGTFERLEAPGFYVGSVTDIQATDKQGQRLKNQNGKLYIRFILTVQGGTEHGKTIVDNVYNTAGFRLDQYCKAVGYDLSINQDKVTFDPNWVLHRPLVFSAQFRQGSDRLNVQLPNDAKGSPVISLEDAKQRHAANEIFVDNLDQLASDDVPGSEF